MKERITPIGVVALLVLAVGVGLVFFASGGASKVGFVIAFVAVAFIVADQLPAGLLRGGYDSQPARGTPADPAPEYIESAATPSEEAWRREQQHYREKERGG